MDVQIQKPAKRVSPKKVMYFSLTLFLVCLITLPILAPVLSHFGYKRLSTIIYDIYQFMCHQKAHRSLFIYDEQCAWCARDTFIWTTVFVVWVFIMSSKKTIKGLNWKVAVALALPMALDGGIQFIATIVSVRTGQTPFYESTNTIRAFTGTLFGAAVSGFLFPRLREELESQEK